MILRRGQMISRKACRRLFPVIFVGLAKSLEPCEWCESPEDHAGSYQPTDPFSVGRERLDADEHCEGGHPHGGGGLDARPVRAEGYQYWITDQSKGLCRAFVPSLFKMISSS